MNESALVTLRGNTHPLAQPQFDQGAAPPDLPMARMLLVLKRSGAQEAALQKLLDDQQDRNSPSYHQWLTPDSLGQQFGPSDQDVQAVAAWLRSHGFQIGMIGKGRTVIEFSGTAAQVRQAFHTEIHKYTVDGKDHWANASDPQIPQAISPLVGGVASLHNFSKQPQYRIAGKFSRDNATGKIQPLMPDFTIVDTSTCSGTGNCYFVGPYDFAKIYNVTPLWNSNPAIDGTGQSIAIVSESNINVQDVRDFRSLFGLPPNDPEIFLNGPDPGLVQGPETEALLDVEWAGAIAKGAKIKLVVSPPTNSTEGADLAGLYAVENNLAPIISESWGDCELFLGAGGNSFESAIREQAAAQGITYINSSGDEGSARCDPTSSTPAFASHGLMVSGLASTPYGVAVGGTDFLNFGPTYNHNSPSPYWSATNDSNHASALGYVPETVWNDNCTNPVFIALGYGTTPEGSCNSSRIATRWISTVASGGGKSNCTVSDQTNPSFCMGGYTKPSWQVAPGIPADGMRDIPDVSLFAGAGFMDSGYIICESDELPAPRSCSLNSPFTTFLGVGGTSAAAPSFAGIMALVNQYTNSFGQGNANYTLYRLASSSTQTSNSCSATSGPSPNCIFRDVTFGANTVPCWNGTYECTSSSGDSYGVLSGYPAGTGYDLATGLGSVNAYNLVHAWAMPSTPSSITLSLSPTTLTHGQRVNYRIAVTPSTATGDVSLIGTLTSSSSDGIASFTLQSGAASGTTAALEGGGGKSYQVRAHYPGDLTYAASDSPPVTVTVSPEPSKPVIWISQSNSAAPNNPTLVPYGTPISATVGVGNAQAIAAIPPQPVCALLTCPTGVVTVSESMNGGANVSVGPAAGLPVDITGETQNFTFPLLAGGQYHISANYPGDNSYQPGTGTYALTVALAFAYMNFNTLLPRPVLVGTNSTLSVTVVSFVASGATPTGTITFADGGTLIPGTETYTSQSGAGITGSLTASIPYTLSAAGDHQLVASYSGDTNYSANSTTMFVSAVYPTSMTESLSAMTINAGQSVTVTAVTQSATKNPAMTGLFQFYGNPFFTPITVTPTLTTDASGNQVLTATTTVTPQQFGSQSITANYLGDPNYESGFALQNVTVNPPDFTLGSSVPSLTIAAGQSGSALVTVTPLSSLSSPVSLICNLSPIVGATCSFSPNSQLSLSNGTAASAMMTITTIAPSSSATTQFVMPQVPRKKEMPPGGWVFVAADGFAVLILSLWSGRRYRRLATSLGMVCLLFLAIGCGSGSGGGGNGGGGGGGGQLPTTLILTTSAVKVPSGSTVTLTATVHSTQSPTGTVTLGEPGLQLGAATLMNGTASFQLQNLPVGTHVIGAAYSGDSNNQGSQTSGTIAVAITGTVQISVSGATGVLTHTAPVSVTIQ